jgi:hypothetical protein
MGNVDPEFCWAKTGWGSIPHPFLFYNGLRFHHRFVGRNKAIDFYHFLFSVGIAVIITPMLF